MNCTWCGLAISPTFPEKSVRLTSPEARRRERPPRYGYAGVMAAVFSESLRGVANLEPPLVVDWRFHRECLDKLARIMEDRL